MPVSLSDAVDDLLGRKTQDPGRLNMLATQNVCLQILAKYLLERAKSAIGTSASVSDDSQTRLL
jgi:hypothetical protein